MKPQDQETAPADDVRMREWLSALADGQPDAEGEGCARWMADAEARRAWHAYHLVGDVLRSEDLASTAGHDEAFLLALRSRLASEPVILAPTPAARTNKVPAAPAPRRWAAAAAAAGFMLVGGAVVMVQRSPSPASLASAQTPGAGALTLSATAGTNAPRAAPPASAALGDPQWRVIDGNLIRDARLDAYLRAHRGLEAARPGAVAGRFETVVLER
jgi:sigma-E factor negative regulatory protein RseA